MLLPPLLRKDFESFAAQFFDSKIKSLALFAIYYNFMHVHKTPRTAPAMMATPWASGARHAVQQTA
jgi:hypothetical protein